VGPQGQISSAEVERMMKVQEVILKAMAGKLKWWEAAEIIGEEPAPTRYLIDSATAAPFSRSQMLALNAAGGPEGIRTAGTD